MADLITLVRTYNLAERFSLTEQIIHRIAGEMYVFVWARAATEDALQEVLKAVMLGLKNFQGNTEKEFWGWCHQIARNKLNDHYREQTYSPMIPTSPDEIWRLMELSAEDAPLTAQNRHDLDYVMKLLAAAKPGCENLLWKHFILEFDYTELAEAEAVNYDAMRMKINRCLETAKSLVA